MVTLIFVFSSLLKNYLSTNFIYPLKHFFKVFCFFFRIRNFDKSVCLANTLGAEILYSLIKDSMKLDNETVLFDICCGTGTIGITLANVNS